MDAGRLPVDEQVAAFQSALDRTGTLAQVLARAAAVDLPGWHLVAGCLYQTVWNVVTGQPPEAGILDYDLAYFDGAGLSWDAEDAVIRAGQTVFAGLPAPAQIRNQARVHLWYEQKFGTRARRTHAHRPRSTPSRPPPPALGIRLLPGVRRARAGHRPAPGFPWPGPAGSSRSTACRRLVPQDALRRPIRRAVGRNPSRPLIEIDLDSHQQVGHDVVDGSPAKALAATAGGRGHAAN